MTRRTSGAQLYERPASSANEKRTGYAIGERALCRVV